MWTEVARSIAAATDRPYAVRFHEAVAGGCTHAAYRVSDGQRDYFVKTGPVAVHDAFTAEADALATLEATHTVRVPRPICTGGAGDAAWLVLEWIELHPLDAPSARRLGEQLAQLHTHVGASYGWDYDNWIGRGTQANARCADWVEFWRERRLRPRLALALKNGYGSRLQRDGKRLLERLDRFFAGYAPEASLLHGDLWSGNAGRDAAGAPVIFDPASYYGDRETDLAMTELFGGFPATFHAAYRAAHPLDPGYAERRTLYNLYHVLNHLNLFGTVYLRQAQAMIEQLVAAA